MTVTLCYYFLIAVQHAGELLYGGGTRGTTERYICDTQCS